MLRPNAILAFDTAMDACSAAVVRADGRAFSIAEKMARGQAQRLIPMIDEAMARAGIGYEDIGLIVTTTGPGAFTGLRIGLSSARALALALDCRIVGVTTLEALAAQYAASPGKDENPVLALIETRREDFYVQVFSPAGVPLDDARTCTAETILPVLERPVTLIGDAPPRLASLITLPETARIATGFETIDPVVLAQVGADQGKKESASPPRPVYLREADVTLPSGRQQQAGP